MPHTQTFWQVNQLHECKSRLRRRHVAFCAACRWAFHQLSYGLATCVGSKLPILLTFWSRAVFILQALMPVFSTINVRCIDCPQLDLFCRPRADSYSSLFVCFVFAFVAFLLWLSLGLSGIKHLSERNALDPNPSNRHILLAI